MSATFDPSWGVPVVGLVIAAAGVIWARLTVSAFEREYGPDPE